MKAPYTDTDAGWVHLYRYSNADFAYQNGLSHELSHAYRFAHIKKHDGDRATGYGFLEEGLAEYISSVIEPKKPGFSTYGFSLVVTSGHWLAEADQIPLEKLLNQFGELDQKCMLQAYAERSSFVEFLDQSFSRERLLQIAYLDEPINAETFKNIFKSDFSTLEQRWQEWLKNQISRKKNFKEQSSRYTKAYVQRGMYVCVPGTDF